MSWCAGDYVDRDIYSSSWLRQARRNARERVDGDLRGPLAVYGLLAGDRAQIERQVRDINPIAAAHEACREEEAHRRAIAQAVEVTELGNGFASLVGDNDLVGLVRAHPHVVVVVDHQRVRAVAAVGEDARVDGY